MSGSKSAASIDLEQMAQVLAPLLLDRLMPDIMARIADEKPWKKNVFIPAMSTYQISAADPFMAHSTCSSRDFFHPDFKALSDKLGTPMVFHRKYWEWVFITHHGLKCLGPGKRAVGFGVGQETLPSVFAAMGANVTATDAPPEIGIGNGWASGNEFAMGLDALPHGVMDRVEFLRHVEYAECDMNQIDLALRNYDFCWSSCCLEHLGSLRAGLDFIINSLDTLNPGGIACHTTELNLSSNEDTVESGATVLYRLRDIEQLIRELHDMGHSVEPFTIAPDSLAVDFYVDTPTYLAPPHLKLSLLGYTSTSAGVVIRKGQG